MYTPPAEQSAYRSRTARAPTERANETPHCTPGTCGFTYACTCTYATLLLHCRCYLLPVNQQRLFCRRREPGLLLTLLAQLVPQVEEGGDDGRRRKEHHVRPLGDGLEGGRAVQAGDAVGERVAAGDASQDEVDVVEDCSSGGSNTEREQRSGADAQVPSSIAGREPQTLTPPIMSATTTEKPTYVKSAPQSARCVSAADDISSC
jgi:hypothetical protein